MIPINSGFKQTIDIIEKLLNLDSSLDDSIFKKTKFNQIDLENAYLVEDNKLDEIFKIKSDILITLGWLSIFIYIYFAFYNLLYVIVCSILISISLILSCFRYFNK